MNIIKSICLYSSTFSQPPNMILLTHLEPMLAPFFLFLKASCETFLNLKGIVYGVTLRSYIAVSVQDV